MNILNQKDKNLRYIEPAFEIDLNKVRLLFRGKYPDESEIIDRIENLNYYWKAIEFLNIPKKLKCIGKIYHKLRWKNATLMELDLQYDEIYHYLLKKFPDLRKYNHKICPRTQLSIREPTGTSRKYHPNPDLIFKFR